MSLWELLRLIVCVCVCVAGVAMHEEWAGLLLQFWRSDPEEVRFPVSGAPVVCARGVPGCGLV